MSAEPRELTEAEVTDRFLDQIIGTIDYWLELPDKTCRERVNGAVFSILVALDGGHIGLPGFRVVPCPHPDDKVYLRENGENWFPDNVDIAGGLHEQFAGRKHK